MGNVPFVRTKVSFPHGEYTFSLKHGAVNSPYIAFHGSLKVYISNFIHFLIS